ncbi:M56 family metallopeptidase [Robiginitalea sp. IMCC44478]|uniref:M56 family metallopeptidase n=1 Tax=Robiginitalea sp. IMCC44478 TaxID=3459122 RepID=UPI0040424DD3
MEALGWYLLKASVVLGLFLGFYHLLLKRETLFRLNRVFLLSGLGTALVLPLITIKKEIIIPAGINQAEVSPITAQQTLAGNGFAWEGLLTTAYGIGLFCCAIMLLWQLLKIYRLIRSQQGVRQQGFVYIATRNTTAPFSFFRYIFYNPDQHDEKELELILEHERAHAGQYHSVDILFGRLLTMVLWLNPLSWLYQKSIQQNLEYLADAEAIRKVSSIKQYQYTLLKVSGNQLTPSLVNTFYSSLIKKRIVMLHQNQSKTIHAFKHLLILPLLAVFLMAFNTEKVYVLETSPDLLENVNEKVIEFTISKNSTEEDLQKMKADLAKDKIDLSYTTVRNDAREIIDISIQISGEAENGSTFSGSYNADSDEPIKPIIIRIDSKGSMFIGNAESSGSSMKHFGHSKNATVWVDGSGNKTTKTIEIKSENGKDMIWVDGEEVDIQEIKENADGNVFVIKKEISTDGEDGEHKVHRIKLRETDADNNIMILSEDDAGLHLEEGADGKKKIQVRVKKDGDEQDVETIIIITNSDDASQHKGQSHVRMMSDSKALIYIDGKKASRKEMNQLDPSEIKTINVWKGDKATEKYGKKAKEGVIEITTKKGN